MSKSRSLCLLSSFSLALTLLACAQVHDADTASTSSSRPLPITGTWRLVHVKGSALQGVGAAAKDIPVDRTFEAGPEATLAKFEIDGDGNGTIKGEVSCAPAIIAQERPSELQESKLANASEGVVMFIKSLVELHETYNCKGDEKEEGEIQVFKKVGLLGRPDPRFAANVGVMGEAKDTKAADKECVALRGYRYMKFEDGSIGCIGYSDSAANKMKMLVQKAADIHIQRIELQRGK